VQLAADALKLGAETIAKHTAAAPSLNGSSQVLTGINKALQGDAFGSATAMSLAAEKLAPSLSTSGIGAVTSVVMLGLCDDKVRAQAEDVKRKAKDLVGPHASGAQRAKAALDLGVSVQGLANVLRTLSQSLVNLLAFAVRAMGRSTVLAPTASSLSMVAREMAATPGGRLLAGLNRWMPIVNIAGVALSGKTAIEVVRTPNASPLSKALSVASIATSLVAVFAAVNFGAMAFVALLGTSIAIDLALGSSRRADAGKQAHPPAPARQAEATPLARRPLHLVG
jgi:hypothetical protein